MVRVGKVATGSVSLRSFSNAPAQATLIEPKLNAFADLRDAEFDSGICPMPLYQPPQYEDVSADEPEFDPDIHLNIEHPSKVTLLDFTEAKLPPQVRGNAPSRLAYTQAFRLLSAEGVRVLREILARNHNLVKSAERQPSYIRGLAYTSKFIRALNEHPRVLDVLSQYAGHRVVPHYMPMNYGHVNYGQLPKEGEVNTRPVDQWHADSVPFVLIVILSDMTDMEGGELECVKRAGRQAGFDLLAETNNSPPKTDLLSVSYERQGYALFMQGSDIIHHVTPVQKAKEPRITLINSYIPANCFAIDRTVYATFLNDNEPEAVLEFARGRAWRAQSQLQAFIQQQPYTENPAEVAGYLSRVISELQMTVDLLTGKVDDTMDFFHETDDEGNPLFPRKM